MKVTLHRFGRNRRLVLILEWLTLWPTCGPLAVSSQRRDISQNPLPSRAFRPALGNETGVQIMSILGTADALGQSGRASRFGSRKSRFRERSDAFSHHINGVFAPDIRVPRANPSLRV